MNVKILEITPNSIQLLYRAFKTCVSAENPTMIKIPKKVKNRIPVESGSFVSYEPDNDKMIDLIKRHISHESVLEHVNITFAIEGVSRSLSHQLVRHRVASYSQQSQRYVKLGQFEYVIPPAIEEMSGVKAMYVDLMNRIQKTYDLIETELEAKYLYDETLTVSQAEKKAIEDARYVFPNACYTNLIWTTNLREFRHAYSERSCENAQWEIREMINKAMKEIKTIIPFANYKAKKCGISCFECYKVEGEK